MKILFVILFLLKGLSAHASLSFNSYSDTLTQVKYITGSNGSFVVAGKKPSQKECFINIAVFDTSSTPIYIQKIKIKNRFSIFSEFIVLDHSRYLLRCTSDIDSTKGYYAILDTSLSILSQGEYDSKELNKSKIISNTNFTKQILTNNYSVAPVTDSFSYKENKLIKNNDLTFKLRAFKIMPLNFPNVYKCIWELGLEVIQNIRQVKFINTNQVIQMVWIVGEEYGVLGTQLILFDSNTGALIKKVKLNYSKDISVLLCSNYILSNNKHDIIIAGNYFASVKSWQRAMSLNAPTGWFALRLSYNGDTLASIFSNKLISHTEIGSNQTLIVRSIIEDITGNLELISECYSKRSGQPVKSASNIFVLNAIAYYRLTAKFVLQANSAITSVTHFQGVDLTTSLNNDNRPLEFQDILLNQNVKPFLWSVLDCGMNTKKYFFYSKVVPVKYYTSTGKVINLESPHAALSTGNVMYVKSISPEYVLVMWRMGDVYFVKKEVW